MFKRVTPEEWSQITAVAAFALTFLVFLAALIKSWRMSRNTSRHMAFLPLEESVDTSENEAARIETDSVRSHSGLR